MTFSDAISEFVHACKLRKLSPHTYKAYGSDLRLFQVWNREANIQMAMTPEAIKAWRCHMDDQAFASTTIKRRLATLKAFAKWLENEEHVTPDPFRSLNLPIKLPRRLPRNVQNGELRKLLRHIRSPLSNSNHTQVLIHLIVELILSTGMRISEACAITLADINLQDRIVRLHGKGNRERQVFLIDDDLVELVERYLTLRQKAYPSTDHLFVTTRGTQASPDYIRCRLHDAVNRSDINVRVTPHMLRHTAATQFLESGVDIRYVQRLLGHSSIATTEIYTHVSNAALRDAVMSAGLRKQWE